MSKVTVSQTDRELIFDRTYKAPRDLVWKAFTEADRIRITPILFAEESGNTRITARIECKTVEELTALTNMGIIPGYTETLGNLEKYLNELGGTGE